MPESFARASRAFSRKSYFAVANNTSEIFTFKPRGVSVVGRMRLNCNREQRATAAAPVEHELRHPGLWPHRLVLWWPRHAPGRRQLVPVGHALELRDGRH